MVMEYRRVIERYIASIVGLSKEIVHSILTEPYSTQEGICLQIANTRLASTKKTLARYALRYNPVICLSKTYFYAFLIVLVRVLKTLLDSIVMVNQVQERLAVVPI